MRQLVVCCDGTWNTPEQESVTNVFRLFRALGEKDAEGNEQLAYYQAGVGVGGFLAWLAGGIAGVGLSANVKDAYRWVTTTYEPDDRIALFGFSRGAYTARSLAGMISACGLLDTRDQDDATIRRQIEQLYFRKYRAAGRALPSWREGLEFRFDPAYADQIPVHFIGAWDTIGALGIPDNLGLLNFLDYRRWYAFHELRLNPHIRCARHAVAMDERRGPFIPAMWDESRKEPGQDLQQVFFPGSHLDVGGGHCETGLSDGALLWMLEEAAQNAKLSFDDEMLKQVSPNDGDVIHDDDRSAVGSLWPLYDSLIGPLNQMILGTRPRAIPQIDAEAQNGRVHHSAYRRQQRKILTTWPYRPTRVLRARGFPETVTVHARESWNATGLFLEPGEYIFAADGEWQGAHIWLGPGGTRGLARLNPVMEGLRLVGTVLGLAEKVVRWASRNEAANLLGSRREEDLPWMSLVGVVANDDGGKPTNENSPAAHQRIAIGRGTHEPVTVAKGGYLYAFANDAWGFYTNNSGSVRLTVTRTA
jgi:hypothetical protein